MDERAIKILIDTYWTSAGWRDERSVSTDPDEFKYARRAGVMFDPVPLAHAQIIRRAVKAVIGLNRRDVANAFVVSLASRQLHFRSALGSFAVLQHFPKHKATLWREECETCGQWNGRPEIEDLNILNFERLKWGGVRHGEPCYAGFDLDQFKKLPEIHPVRDDVQALRALLHAIESVPSKTTSATLQKYLATIIPSSKQERDVLIGILGLCGILETADHPGFMRKFVRYCDRDLPERRFVDMAYPACWWRRSDGVNTKAVKYWFGHLLK